MKTKFSAFVLMKALGLTSKKISYTLKIENREKKGTRKITSNLVEISESLGEKDSNILRLNFMCFKK